MLKGILKDETFFFFPCKEPGADFTEFMQLLNSRLCFFPRDQSVEGSDVAAPE